MENTKSRMNDQNSHGENLNKQQAINVVEKLFKENKISLEKRNFLISSIKQTKEKKTKIIE